MTPQQPEKGRLILDDHSAAQAVERRLHSSPYLALKTIHWECHGGVLVLTGHLPSYYLKQMAQALFTNLEGIQRIDNRIEVVVPASLLRSHQTSGPAGEAQSHLSALPGSLSQGG